MSNGFLPFSALIRSGATYNFVFKAVWDGIRMHPAKAGRQKRAIAKLPSIAAVDGESLHTMAVVQHMVYMRDSTSVKCYHVINFVITNIARYDVISEMAWLQKQNPDMH